MSQSHHIDEQTINAKGELIIKYTDGVINT
jgi:hypothetical protein